MKEKFFSWAVVVLVSAVFIIPYQVLRAEFVCEGNLCRNFPGLISDLNGVINQVENDYLQEILKNNTEAAFLANALASQTGRGHVDRFQVGVGLSVAGGKKENLSIVTERIKWENLPNGGLSLSPSFSLALNLGWILRRPKDSYWNRFSLYLHGMDARLSQADLKTVTEVDERLTIATRFQNAGAMIRFQVVEPKPFLGFVFTWNGINLGGGAHKSLEESNVTYTNRNPQSLNWNNLEARWGGDAIFAYKTNAQTYNADIRTGLGILYIFQITLGGGMTWNSGESELQLRREGPFILKTGSIASWEVPREYQDLFPIDSTQESGTIGLRSQVRGRSRRSIGYGILALEFQLLGLGVVLEGMYSNPSLAGATLGVRYSF